MSGTVEKARRIEVKPPGSRSAPPEARTWMGNTLIRPETSSVVGVIGVFTFFAITGGQTFLSFVGIESFLEVAAEVGIIATAITLLMIAGEFDVSVGSVLGATAIMFAALVTGGTPLWLALLLTFAAGAGIGLFNAFLVMKTGLPSFIVTMAGLFLINGLASGLTVTYAHGTQIIGLKEHVGNDPLVHLFLGTIHGVSVTVVWWILLTVFATWLLTRTRFGNWIYAVGGDREAARKSGVPIRWVKTVLFVFTAMSAALVGVLSTLPVNTAEVNQGSGMEFQVIAAAVMGGALITGGYGSPVGTALGALIFGMVTQGFYFTNINSLWFNVFLGVMILVAVTVNFYAAGATLKRRS